MKPNCSICVYLPKTGNIAGFSQEVVMEIVYFAGAFILLSALIYGTLHTRHRNRYQRKVSDQIVRDRYEHNIN